MSPLTATPTEPAAPSTSSSAMPPATKPHPPAPPADAVDQDGGQSLAHWLRSGISTLVVFTVLAGLAWWGHANDWTLPKFGALLGQQAAPPDDWCVAHNVAESECIECNVALVPPAKNYGWCREHGVAQCPLEHPDVAQLKTIPVVSTEDRQRAERGLALRPRAENNSLCKLHERRIQFATVEAMAKAGVDISLVQRRPIVEAVEANGEVVYDQTCSAHLASRVTGAVRRVERQVGHRVRKGDVLALIESADIGRAKAEFLQALAQLRLKRGNADRLKPLANSGTVSGQQFQQAEAALQESQIRLLGAQQALVNLGLPVRHEDFAELSTDRIAERIQFLGLPAELVDSLDGESTTSNLFPLRSPLDGVVVECDVVAGEVVDASTTLFGVADVSRMWLTLDVRQDDVKYVSHGQEVLFRPSDSLDEPEIRGTVGWISTSADDRTRTVKVRVDLPNLDGRLRANTFGAGRIVLRQEAQATVVPSEAVHWDGDCQIVFVRDKDFLRDGAPKFFHIRKVRVGVKSGGWTEILVGLLPGEVIASKNSVVLEAQLLKSNLGAGCGCADGH